MGDETEIKSLFYLFQHRIELGNGITFHYQEMYCLKNPDWVI